MEEKEDVPVDKIGDNIDDLKVESFEVLNIEVWYIWFSKTFIAYWLSTLSLQPKENISEKKESEEKDKSKADQKQKSEEVDDCSCPEGCHK